MRSTSVLGSQGKWCEALGRKRLPLWVYQCTLDCPHRSVRTWLLSVLSLQYKNNSTEIVNVQFAQVMAQAVGRPFQNRIPSPDKSCWEDDWCGRFLRADNISLQCLCRGKRPSTGRRSRPVYFYKSISSGLVALFPVVPRNPATGFQEDVGDREQRLAEWQSIIISIFASLFPIKIIWGKNTCSRRAKVKTMKSRMGHESPLVRGRVPRSRFCKLKTDLFTHSLLFNK